MVYYIDYIINF